MRIAGGCSPVLVCVIPPLSAVAQSIVLQVAIVVHVVLSAVPSLVLIVARGSVCGLPRPAKFIAAVVVLFVAPIVAVVHCSVVAHIFAVFIVMICWERRRRGLVLQLGAGRSDVVAHVYVCTCGAARSRTRRQTAMLRATRPVRFGPGTGGLTWAWVQKRVLTSCNTLHSIVHKL